LIIYFATSLVNKDGHISSCLKNLIRISVRIIYFNAFNYTVSRRIIVGDFLKRRISNLPTYRPTRDSAYTTGLYSRCVAVAAVQDLLLRCNSSCRPTWDVVTISFPWVVCM